MTANIGNPVSVVKYINANLILDDRSLFPLQSESIRSLRTPTGDSGWRERKAGNYALDLAIRVT